MAYYQPSITPWQDTELNIRASMLRQWQTLFREYDDDERASYQGLQKSYPQDVELNFYT